MEGFQLYVVVMAGGRGRRLWPLSTPERPKQFIELNGKSLLERTYDRISPMVEDGRVIVVTGADKGQLVLEDLPNLPEENVIEEPVGKNTAPCIGLAAALSEKLLGVNEDRSVMAVLPADHLVGREERFRKLLKSAARVAYERNRLITLGIDPTRAATGYGYIEAGEDLPGEAETRDVVSFTEKPDRETAEEFLAAGNYYWNSGTFIWRTDTLLDGMKEHMPDLYNGLERIKSAAGTSDEAETIAGEYESFSSTSIDYGLMEKADNRGVLPVSVDWSDLGDWTSISKLLESDDADNSCYGDVICRESANNLIYNETEKSVIGLGLEDVVVVNTDEALLVMDKSKTQEVKSVAQEFEDE